MAYALVGSLGAVAEGTSPAAAFGQATTAGNLLIAWIGNGAGNTVSESSGWTQATGITAAVRAQIWYKENCGASESAPSFSSTSSFAVRLGEFSGGSTSSPPTDQARNTVSGGASPITNTADAADVAAGELVIGTVGILLSKAGTDTTTVTFNNGATTLGQANNDATSTNVHYRFAYGITTGNSSADTVTGTDTSMNLSSMAVALTSFKLAAAGPAASLVYNPRSLQYLRVR